MLNHSNLNNLVIHRKQIPEALQDNGRQRTQKCLSVVLDLPFVDFVFRSISHICTATIHRRYAGDMPQITNH